VGGANAGAGGVKAEAGAGGTSGSGKAGSGGSEAGAGGAPVIIEDAGQDAEVDASTDAAQDTPECVNGDAHCDYLDVVTCSAGAWTTTETCPYLCNDGVCSGSCMPGAKQCSAFGAQTCTAQGAWVTDQSSCTPNARKCNGTVALECNTCGQWVTAEICANVCSAGSCTGTCVPESLQCSGLNAQSCDDSGNWQTTVTCPYVCSNGGCLGVCTPGATRCSGANIQTCGPTGQWQTAQACPSKANATVSCSMNQCTFACNADYQDCNGDAGDGCEVSLQTDSNNCNACGRTCCGGGACSAGTCQPATVVPGNWTYFEMDATNYYTVSPTDVATIKKTPRAGGATTDFVPSTVSNGRVLQLLLIGTDLYWTAQNPSTNNIDIYATSVSGGVTTPVTSSSSVWNMIFDGTDLIWSKNGSQGIQWKTLASNASGVTLNSANSYWVASDGEYLYYAESSMIYNSCGGSSQVAAYTSTLKKVPVHGGTPSLLDAGCGEYTDLAIVGSNLYYGVTRRSSALDGRYTVPLAGGVAPTKIGYGGVSLVSDEANLYYCNSVLFKKPISGGTAVSLVPSQYGYCRDLKLDGQCVYYNSGPIMTVNKSP